MQCYTELVPPSGVTHSLHISFTSSEANNLIVARTSVLQIFTYKQINHGHDTKLVLVAEFALSGVVTALGGVKVLKSDSGGDALLVAFRDAKLSLVQWNPPHHSISTISIHFYENHDLLQCPWTPDLQDCISHLTVDPSSRCAAFHFGVSNLAIIPFHQSGDDLAMDDFDDLREEKPDSTTIRDANGNAIDHDKPYAPSFVLPLTVLDPSLVHPVDIAFLHEYRQPTIGILYSVLAPSNNMAEERKDVMIYAVYTLDIDQRASTTLSSITKLPNDLYKIIALPPPVGGSLLIGGNEIIHIDQSGKANALGVNEFAKESSAFPMNDQSELRMRLEGCQIENLGHSGGAMLMTLSTGALVVLSFRLDGRSVSGLSLQPIDANDSVSTVKARASTMTNIGLGRVFIGSEDSDSILLGPTRQNTQPKRQNSRILHENGHQDFDQDSEESDHDDDDDDDDDLYTDSKGGEAQSVNITGGNNLRELDRLCNIGPINSLTFGRPFNGRENVEDFQVKDDEALPSLEIAMAVGRGQAGALAFLAREVRPVIVKQTTHENATGIWSLKTTDNDEGNITAYDDTVIISMTSDKGSARSQLMTLSDGELDPREGTEFDGNTTTIAVGRFTRTNHTVQVSSNDVRLYDTDFGLSQIFPIVDEDSGEIAQVISAACIEPYVIFVKDDRSLSILKVDSSGELDKVDLPSSMSSTEVVSASLYHDVNDFFATSKYSANLNTSNMILLSVLTSDGKFSLYTMSDLKLQIFEYSGLNFLPTQLSSETPIPKHWKNADTISELQIADIGDETDTKPHLILHTTTGDVVVYEAYSIAAVSGAYRFKKIATKIADVFGANADDSDEEDEVQQQRGQLLQQLQAFRTVDGYRVVFVSGHNPAILLKSASSSLRIHKFRAKSVRHVSSAHDSHCPVGFVYIDSDARVNFAQLSSDTIYSLSDFPVRKVLLGEHVTDVAYHPETSTYILATEQPTEFQLPQDDEWHPEWTEETTGFLPNTDLSSIKLFSPSSNRTISTYTFEPCERVLSLKCLPLEISEETHEIADLIVVGTAVTKGENVVTRGNIYIFSIASVNPIPGIPESNLKLKLITKEDVRGSVSAITAVGSQGYFLAAQGQKCMVRGLKEDKSILPVAFLDMRYHTHVAKELPGTGLTILGDAFSGLWLMGYSEEPYKLQLLSRDLEDRECIAADFLPDSKQLFIITADGNGDLRILEFDPENPKTERGMKLLERSTFSTGSYQTNIVLVPRTPTSSELLNNDNASTSYGGGAMDIDDDQEIQKRNQILLTSQSGAMSLITPLSTQTYRRLSTMQNILTNQLEQPCGLNPRAFRAVETDGMGGRGIIDGDVIRRWRNLSSWHKASLADKVGGTVWEVRTDMEIVSGQGLGYL